MILRGAIDDYSKAIDINNNDSGAYYSRGLAKLKLNKFQSACEDLNIAYRLGDVQSKSLILKYCN